ncbi:helix-turn-helix domain-containing protein [Streptacidiphilus griseoplanus]|uniref:helix-turn-helix domain-containing protein n=1 Tax=Peterkaempfera griseoplana TaxID=66896 RepID=UPI000AF43DB2|nr:helix-turn-helix transcriptional regulator [Peterkaempfera griseoplana]
MASLNVGSLGEYIREQRRNAQYSLRQLAEAAGVSNPYLSQIERGLRKPSAEILQQIAKALRISAETLYVQAGILDERQEEGLELRAAILADPLINERQRQVLLAIYDSFLKENAAAAPSAPAPSGPVEMAVATARAVGARAAQMRVPGMGTAKDRPQRAQHDVERDPEQDAKDDETSGG